MVALPSCFFCKINSASERTRRPCFMNDGNLLRPSIYLNSASLCTTPASLPPRLPCSRRQGFSNLSCLEKNTLPVASTVRWPLPSTRAHMLTAYTIQTLSGCENKCNSSKQFRVKCWKKVFVFVNMYSVFAFFLIVKYYR